MLWQVTLLSMGYVVYSGPPAGAVGWFNSLGYQYNPLRDGCASDWLIDLVSVGFDKPKVCAAVLWPGAWSEMWPRLLGLASWACTTHIISDGVSCMTFCSSCMHAWRQPCRV